MRRPKTPTPPPLATLADLTPDDRNPNRGTARGRATLTASLQAHGAARSIVVDRHGVVLCGNKTLEAARGLNLPLTIVQSSGDQLVAVQRVDLDLATDTAARQLALADNRVAELDLSWDPTLLAGFVTDGVALDPWWTPDELEALIGEALGAQGHTSDDAVVAPTPTSIQRGQLFALGAHRLLCGDATSLPDVTRLLNGASPMLMVTDPPYGVSYDPAWRADALAQGNTAVGKVANDDRVDWSAAYQLFTGAVAYVWHAGVHASAVATSLEQCDFNIRSQIIWVKQHFALSRGHYHWQHEPCWYAVRRGQSAGWRGSRTQSTVWEAPNLNSHGGDRTGENAPTGHGTQKPVRLFELPILNHTRRGDTVYEPFCGSGTALIAAQKTGRRCLAIELDPRYVQAAIDRWEAYTGHAATVVEA